MLYFFRESSSVKENLHRFLLCIAHPGLSSKPVQTVQAIKHLPINCLVKHTWASVAATLSTS